MPHNPALDGLRAIAALAVIAFHSKVPGLHGGFVGVDVFFVLSGFLITRLLADEYRRSGTIDCITFYGRRLWRLTPTLLLMLAVYLAVAPFVWPQVSSAAHLRDAAIAAAYLSDYAQAYWSVPRFLVHTWSLSVETHFYLVWPVVLLCLLRLPFRLRFQVMAALYFGALAWRIYSCVAGSFDAVYYGFDTRLSGLMLGALLGMLPERSFTGTPRMLTELGAVSTMCLIVLLITAPWGEPSAIAMHVTAAQVAAAGLIIVIAASPDTPFYRVLSAWPLVMMGVLSYGLYIWHYPISIALRDSLPWYWTFALTLTLSFLGAVVCYLAVDRRRRQLRDASKRQSAGSPRQDGFGSLDEARGAAAAAARPPSRVP